MPKSRVSAEPNGLFRTGSRQTVRPCTHQLPWDMRAGGRKGHLIIADKFFIEIPLLYLFPAQTK